MAELTRPAFYPIGEIRAATGLNPTTLWRRIQRLQEFGLAERHVKTGGSGGTRSEIEFRGSLDDLRQAIFDAVDGSAISSHRSRVADGPPCPKCGKTTVPRGSVTFECVECRREFARL